MNQAPMIEQSERIYRLIRGRVLYPSNAEDERSAAVAQIRDTLNKIYADGWRAAALRVVEEGWDHAELIADDLIQHANANEGQL